jgi:hypothetical protein
MFDQSAQPYIHVTPPVRVRQQLRGKRVTDLPGGKLLWLAVVKLVVLATPLVLGVNLWLSSASTNLAVTAEELHAIQQAVRDENITLRAEKARLSAPERIGEKVGSRLALYFPDKKQVHRM